MLISQILISICFVSVILLIIFDKINRAVVSLGGALFCFFILTFIEKVDFGVFVDFLFGNNEDGFVNLNSLMIILGMTIIVNICNEAGFFQYFAFKIVLIMGKHPKMLLFILCSITFIISAFINNILTVMVIVPLTITISRILNVDPEPYIVTQAVVVNIGGTLFMFSSIPNILITTYAKISFIDYFLNVGLFSIFIFFCTVGFFQLLYHKRLNIPKENFAVLNEFNPTNYIQSKSLLIKATSVLFGVVICFVIIPTSVIPNSVITIFGAVLLIIISKLDSNALMEKLDMELMLYLLGIFILSGSIENVGIIEVIGNFLRILGNDDPLSLILIIIWVSSTLSATIDNIPITQVLIPVVKLMSVNFPVSQRNYAYYSLAISANWGDNLTPMGDNILVMQIAKKNKRPIRMKEFFRVGFLTTIFQLYITSVYFTIIFNTTIGIIFALLSTIVFGAIYYLMIKGYINKIIKKIKPIRKREENFEGKVEEIIEENIEQKIEENVEKKIEKK